MDRDDDLKVRAAWLHYIVGLKQSDVASRLDVSSIKAHRLIARAVNDGTVKISIEGEVTECLELETALIERFHLQSCTVIPVIGNDEELFNALGMAGANYLQREIAQNEHEIIGMGHGRTLSAMVEKLPKFNGSNLRFVSLLGGLTKNYAANPHDVMYRIAAKTNAEAYVMPVPFFLNSAKDMNVMLSQQGVAEVRELGSRATLKLVGVGTTESDTQIVQSGLVAPDDMAEARSLGCVAELLGRFFNEDGEEVATDLSARTVSVGLPAADNQKVVAIGGGSNKVRAIGSVLRSGHLRGLITDESTAFALVA